MMVSIYAEAHVFSILLLCKDCRNSLRKESAATDEEVLTVIDCQLERNRHCKIPFRYTHGRSFVVWNVSPSIEERAKEERNDKEVYQHDSTQQLCAHFSLALRTHLLNIIIVALSVRFEVLQSASPPWPSLDGRKDEQLKENSWMDSYWLS